VTPRLERPGLVALTWPLAAELLLGTLVGLAGLALAARTSDASSGAYAMANHVQQAFFLLFRIVSMGVGVVITQQLGAGDRRGADATARSALGASTWLALGAASCTSLGAGALLWLAVLLEPGRVFNLVVITALRATGDARFPVVVGSVSMLLVMAGGAWLLGVQFGLGLAGVWIAYAADEWLRGLMMAARWQWRGWLGHAREAHRRVRKARLLASLTK